MTLQSGAITAKISGVLMPKGDSGAKGSQKRDIDRAIRLLNDWEKRNG